MESTSSHAIPPPHDDDDEDVSWALSTASALWASGERSEALKWLRRAAESASDNNADERALELFKAAADVANRMSVPPPSAGATSVAPSAAPPRPPSTAPQRPSAVPSQRITALPETMAHPTMRDPVSSGAPPLPKAPPAPPSSPVSARPASGRDAAPQTSARAGSAAPPPPSTRPSSLPRSSISTAPSAVVPSTPSTKRTDAPPSALPAPAAVPSGMSPVSRTAPAARVSTAARVRPRPVLERRPLDDEVTIQKDFTKHVRLGGAPAPAYDDLEEETNVIPGTSLGTVRTRAKQADDRLTELSPPLDDDTGTPSSDDVAAPTPTDVPPAETTSTRGAAARAPGRDAARTSARDGAASVPVSRAAAPIASIPTVRVAVLGTDTEGEVRLLALAPGSQAPTGAPVAFLVPMTEEDGEAIGRLFTTS